MTLRPYTVTFHWTHQYHAAVQMTVKHCDAPTALRAVALAIRAAELLDKDIPADATIRSITL